MIHTLNVVMRKSVKAVNLAVICGTLRPVYVQGYFIYCRWNESYSLAKALVLDKYYFYPIIHIAHLSFWCSLKNSRTRKRTLSHDLTRQESHNGTPNLT